MKLTEWLDQLDSHTVYEADGLRRDAHKHVESGVLTKMAWPRAKTLERVELEMEQRGIGGYTKGPGYALTYTGYELVEHFAKLLAQKTPPSMGRGRRFREALEFLRDAGY